MIEIRKIDALHSGDINLPNEPFSLYGRLKPSYTDGKWSYAVEHFAKEDVTEMCFPDESHSLEAMGKSIFLGAYDGESCIGLAILEPGFFKYIYLSDLKVDRAYRGRGIGRRLIRQAEEIARQEGYRGIYTIGQDNNLAACLFYLHTGFCIGGLDTNVYRHTEQEGKADILFYRDCE